MHLASFQVRNFRNILDSGLIEVDPAVTCLVGKNESGKSALLEALYLLNPVYKESFDVDEQYPRWRKAQDKRSRDINQSRPIQANFELSDDDVAAVEAVVGPGVLTKNTISVARKYAGGRVWVVPTDEAAAVKNAISAMPTTVGSQLSGVDSPADMNTILEGIEAVDEGEEGPSSADIRAAREVVNTRGLSSEAEGVWRPIVDVLAEGLPRFFKFTEYQTIPGRVDLRRLEPNDDDGPGTSGLRAVRALLDLAQAEVQQIEEDNYELRKGELEAVQIDLTNQVFEYWRQNSALEVNIDVDKETVDTQQGKTAVARFLDIRLKDKRTGYSNNFQQRSSGFQWFFSFLAAFSEFETSEGSMVVLLDEPALGLHGRAQADFLRFINERLATALPVLYTTHSPFMVEAGRLERVRLVEDRGPEQGAVVTTDVLTSDPDSLFPLQAALGYDIAQNLFVGPHNLVVEGTAEYIYLTDLSRRLGDQGRELLDERWGMLPAGGATNIPTFVALIGPHLDVTVLADSDTRGLQKVTGMIQRGLLKPKRFVLVDEALGDNVTNADIEDLFTLGDYLTLFNATFGTNLKVRELPPGDRVTKRIEAHLGEPYDHGAVAEYLLRNHANVAFTDTTLANFEFLFERLNATIET